MIYGAFLLLESPAIFGILAYMNLRIFLIVRLRKKFSRSLEEQTKNTVLKETNSIMRATILQAAVPMLVQLPMLIITGFFIARRPVAKELEHFSIFLHSINPIANVLVTFIVVKSYNRALRSKLRMVAPADATIVGVNRQRELEQVKFSALIKLNQQIMTTAQLKRNLQKQIIDDVKYPVRNSLTTVA
uniref:G protein-coupled receptor n=1 Tax=Plectus sambesii TaxID=2011161 RepID=A0A914WQA4_9BILA